MDYAYTPLRRYFARELDRLIYSLILCALQNFVFHIRLSDARLASQAVSILAGLIVMMAAEPWLLHWFGTTPGKAIFGIRIRRQDGEKLTIQQSFQRTWLVLKDGMGFCIPLYNFYRMFRSYERCFEDQKRLTWDEGLDYEIGENVWYRWAACVAGWLAVLAGMFFCVWAAQLAPHRGELTVKQFSSNYRYLADYYRVDCPIPDFSYEVTDGRIETISFQTEGEGEKRALSGCVDEMELAALAFAGSQKGIGLFSPKRQEIISQVEQGMGRQFQFTLKDVELTADWEYIGYHWDEENRCLIPDDGAEQLWYRITFEMKRIKEP